MELLLGSLLEAAARRAPDAVAVRDGARSVRYGDLDARANQLARVLRAAGVGRGDRVGILLDKSVEAVTALYAVLKAGAAYVPLDPQAPAGRSAVVAGDCGVRVLVGAAGRARAWADLAAAGVEVVVALDVPGVPEVPGLPAGVVGLGSAVVDAQPPAPPTVPLIEDDVAYVLYTSGSTGRPKGVVLTHRNAMAFVRWAREEFAVGPADRVASVAPFHFDLSIFDLYATAAGGATLVLVPPEALAFPLEAVRTIEREAITVWYSVPSLLRMMVLRGRLEPGRLPSLRALLFAGEVFPTPQLRALVALLPHVRFANLYGPTETNVCTWYDVPPLAEDDDAPIPIGWPIPGDEALVIGDDGEPVRPGEVGELVVRGATVMRGYWGDEERTARSLVVGGFGTGVAHAGYRTGDRVRQGPDGCLTYVGRRDAQIKSRGYRIELDEVELALAAHPAVAACAVVAVPDDLVTNRIRAFAVPRAPVAPAELAAHLASALPRYMVPESVALLEELPLTSTGKVDRQALRAGERAGRPAATGG